MQRFRRVCGVDALELFSNGAVRGGSALGGPLWELDGKTLEFTAPSALTVTFVSKSPADPIRAADVIAQLSAQAPGVKAHLRDGRLSLSAPSGVTLGPGGSANALLGFPSAGVAGVPYSSPGGPLPRIILVLESQLVADAFIVWTEE